MKADNKDKKGMKAQFRPLTDKFANEDNFKGQQQGGNHGGGGAKGNKMGNQTTRNSAAVHQRDMDGDLPGGRKGKK